MRQTGTYCVNHVHQHSHMTASSCHVTAGGTYPDIYPWQYEHCAVVCRNRGRVDLDCWYVSSTGLLPNDIPTSDAWGE